MAFASLYLYTCTTSGTNIRHMSMELTSPETSIIFILLFSATQSLNDVRIFFTFLFGSQELDQRQECDESKNRVLNVTDRDQYDGNH